MRGMINIINDSCFGTFQDCAGIAIYLILFIVYIIVLCALFPILKIYTISFAAIIIFIRYHNMVYHSIILCSFMEYDWLYFCILLFIYIKLWLPFSGISRWHPI